MTTEQNNGGPAFPLQSIGPEFSPGYAGMSLRDYFAVHATDADVQAQGEILRSRGNLAGLPDTWIATARYMHADAMLEARK